MTSTRSSQSALKTTTSNPTPTASETGTASTTSTTASAPVTPPGLRAVDAHLPVHPSGPSELPRTSTSSVVNFFTRDIILRIVEGEPVIIVINGFAVKEYLRNNLTVRFCRAPPHSVRKLVPPNSWVVQATSASSALNVAYEIKSAAAITGGEDARFDQKVKVSCN